MEIRTTLLICCLHLITFTIPTAQVDSTQLNVNLNLKLDTITLHGFELKPMDCPAQDSLPKTGITSFSNPDNMFTISLPEKQSILQEANDFVYNFTFADNDGSLENLTTTTLTFYQSETLTAEALFKRDFLKARFNLESLKGIKNIDFRGVGKTLISDQESYWLKLGYESDGTDFPDLDSSAICFYLDHPASKKCMTIFVQTFFIDNFENEVCKHLQYLKTIEWH